MAPSGKLLVLTGTTPTHSLSSDTYEKDDGRKGKTSDSYVIGRLMRPLARRMRRGSAKREDGTWIAPRRGKISGVIGSLQNDTLAGQLCVFPDSFI